MFNPYFLQKYTKMRHDEFLAEAQLERLLREIESTQLGLGQKLRWQMGDWLITFGCKLKAHSELRVWEKAYQIKQ